MKFSPSFLEELRNRLRISEVVGRKVRLKPHGRGEFTGLCPFHKEKTPSFTVSDDKSFYHCFGCGAHGDIIKFTMESSGASFTEAVSSLAGEAGMSLPAPDKNEEAKYEKYDQGYEALDAACKWYQEQLQLSGSSTAREYLQKRRLTGQTISNFRIGYAPGNNSLKNAMLARGFSEETLVETGLIIKKDNGDSFDRFRDRIMFPIMDAKGRVIAFGGRILGEGEPKYLNSPETYLFKKGYILYGWHLARQTAYDKANIVVVEGYMDVIAMYQAGIKNVVAPLGTALTENHLRLLWRVVKEPVLCMDGDSAGKRAMYRAANNYISLLEPGYSIKFAVLPSGSDPDDVIKDQGVDAMREILASATPLSETIWEFECAQKPLNTPEQKADLQQRLMKLVSSIKEKTVQEYYRKHFNDKLWNFSSGYKSSKKNDSGRLTSLKLSSKTEGFEKERYETMLFKLVLHYPELLDDTEVENELIHLTVSQIRYSEMRDKILEFYASSEETPNKESLLEYLEKLEFNNQIDHIKSCKFMESFAKAGTPDEIVKSEWRYVVALHNLSSIEEDYSKALSAFQNDVNEETQSQLLELQKQIEILKLSIAAEKKHREALLEE